MVKIGIVSDLHSEFWIPGYELIGSRVQSQLADVDIILLAGDIGVGEMGIQTARSLFPTKPLFMVAGNHEFYEGDYDAVLERLHEAASRLDVTFLHKAVATKRVGDVDIRIIGTTLWTDFDLHGNPPLALLDATALNDFRLITYKGRVLRPSDTLAWHQDERRWIFERLDEPAPETLTILLTHHAPVSFAIGPQFVGDNLSPCFASRMEQGLLRDDLLVVWGHTHHCVDRIIERTRFISNQTGYPVGRTFRTETGQYGQVIETQGNP